MDVYFLWKILRHDHPAGGPTVADIAIGDDAEPTDEDVDAKDQGTLTRASF